MKWCKLVVEQLEDRVTPSTLGSPWPDPGHLTLSFAPDKTNAGGVPSTLSQMLNAGGVSTASWESAILRAFQTWAVNSNVNIGVVPDGGQPLGTTGAAQSDPRFGDIRIASKPLTASAVSTAEPFSWSGTTWGGDVLLNSLYNFGINGAGQYDLYTIALHEAGHALGIGHDSSSVLSAMYDTYIGARTGLSSEDIANIQALYGVRRPDAFQSPTPNNSFSSAALITNSPANLAFNADITTFGQAEYFKIVAPAVLLGLSSFTVQVKTSGISLLEPSLSVYNASGRLVGSAAASSPLNGDISVTIPNPAAGATYYFRVAGNTNDVFSVGSYQTVVSYQSLVGTLTGLLTNLILPIVGNTLSSALVLGPAYPDKTDQRFDYLYKAIMALPGQTDYYQFQAPAAPQGTSYTMHVLAWELSANGLHPEIHVFDAQHNPVAVDVLGNSDGIYSVQVPNASANATYVVEVTALNPLGPNNLGNYSLGIKFDPNAAVALALLASNTLPSSSSADTGTLTMSENGLVHFVLAASNGGASVASLNMTIYDQAGNVVLSLAALTSQPPVTAVVYLQAGTYTVRYTAKNSSGTYAPTAYWLFAEILSDPVGPYISNPTNSPTSSTSSGGYTYTGSSSTNTTTASRPTYY
jgi:hypothetical protein